MTTAIRRDLTRVRHRWWSSAWQRWVERAPNVLGILANLFGVANLLAVFPGGESRAHILSQFAPLPVSAAANAVAASAGLLLLKLGHGLRHRQRRAWRVATGVTTVALVAHVARDFDLEPALLCSILLVLLVVSRRCFRAKADVTSHWRALTVFVQMFVIAVVYGLGMMYVEVDTRVAGDPPFWIRLREVLDGLVGIDGPARLTGPRFPDIFHATMLGFGVVIAFTTAYLALRPTRPRPVLSTADEARLRELLDKQGDRDSLGYFALRRDKSVVWSSSAKAAIAYRVVSGVALASGDPIGDPEAWPGAIAAFQAMAEEYAWVPAVIGCSEMGATVFRREAGLSAIQLGDEAIVPVDEFGLEGRAMRGVRQACTRVQRAGFEIAVRRVRDVGRDEVDSIIRTAASWRGGEVERGFSMALSRIGDPADGACVLVTATRGGTLAGMLHFVPWGPSGLSLDLMRRDHEADNGLSEQMIVSTIQAAPELGVTRVSLNFAAFRDAIERGGRIGAGPALRAWRGLLLFMSRWFQIESLYRFNVKFRPEWETRFLMFPSSRDLVRISVAALEAEAFITMPRPLERLLGR
jgi:lysyl-tRNA synthetase class 2